MGKGNGDDYIREKYRTCVAEAITGLYFPRQCARTDKPHRARCSKAATAIAGAAPGPLLPADLPPTFEAAERWVVEQVQQQTQGNVAETARRLGASRNRIYRIIRES